jgi:type III pantothenate kinase
MANLIIDIGNTLCKVAVFENQVITQNFQHADIDFSFLKEQINFSTISVCLVSSTRTKPENLIAEIQKETKCLWLDFNLKLPFKNKYTTPNTLGKDRMALAAAAASEFKNQNTLVLDAGTCLTYEMVTNENEYLGGAISPGKQMRFKALHSFTEQLPLVEPKKPFNLIGNTTESNIISGVINGMISEMDGTINAYKARFSKLNVVLTGGDQVFFAECLKNNFFARPQFLLKGLNFIAELNA